MPALAAAMLSACASSGPIADAAPASEPNPVVEVRREVIIECPAELANPPQARPQPGPGAVLEYNGPGRDYLAALIGWGGALFDTLTDARAQCPEPEKAAD